MVLLLGGAQLAQVVHRLVLGQARQRLEQPVVVRVVRVVLDLGEREQLWAGEGAVGGAGGGLPEVDFSRGLGERDWVVEGGVAPVCHAEARRGVDGGGVQHRGLQGGEGAAGLGLWGADGPRVLSPALGQVGVVPQLVPHDGLVWGGGVQAPGVVLTGVGQPLLHQLMAVAIGVHLWPVVLGGAVEMATHGGGRVAGALRHDWRPLVRPIGVLLHVLGKVGLLCVGLATVGADVGLQVF